MSARRTFLVTGATGFLGKVVVEELVRRRDELAIDCVGLIIRPMRGLNAQERFRREVLAADCFSKLPEGWECLVTVIEGTLQKPGLALSPESQAFVSSVTHIVHAAASVKFDLPVADAAKANITPSLNMMELAQSMPALERFVYVSTGYVSLNPEGTPIEEVPSPLHAPAAELYGACIYGGSGKTLLEVTGHPNTYTLTKGIAELLLMERRGTVPLTIVRPSIITAARLHPFPGWIDSSAGFGAYVVMIGAGHMRAAVANADARLDLVPVDAVSERIVHAATSDEGDVVIRHAATGLANAPTVRQAWDAIQAFFRVHRVDAHPSGRFVGPRGARFAAVDLIRHRLPNKLSGLKSKSAKRQAEKRTARVDYLNRQFAYFTSRNFDFQTSVPLKRPSRSRELLNTVCRGVYRHVFKADDGEWVLAGRAHPGHGGDLRWIARQPRGNLWVRSAVWVVTKVLRRAVERVTVDLPSFESALALIPEGTTVVIAPSHRSYLDFVLTAYLAFSRPDLLPIPHFAATTDFARIPVLGRVLRALHAFYLRRGAGVDPELAGRVATLLDSGHTLAFFIEGQRSRSGDFLPPKRGLVRCLHATGRPIAFLPIAIAYERVPEQRAFDLELAGQPKSRMRLVKLIGWTMDVFRRRIDLGRIHIACGAPVPMDGASDARVVADTIIARLRDAMEPLGTAARSIDAVTASVGQASAEAGAAASPR